MLITWTVYVKRKRLVIGWKPVEMFPLVGLCLGCAWLSGRYVTHVRYAPVQCAVCSVSAQCCEGTMRGCLAVTSGSHQLVVSWSLSVAESQSGPAPGAEHTLQSVRLLGAVEPWSRGTQPDHDTADHVRSDNTKTRNLPGSGDLWEVIV